MKTLTKLAVASFLALTVAAPAFAGEEDVLVERNTYASAVNAQHASRSGVQTHRAADAFASAPRNLTVPTGPDFSIENQGY